MTVTSQLMGLAPGVLRRYERGERTPGLEELKLIANYYNIGLDDFCWDEGQKDQKL
jgi:transcriptional regulator with XRE-family HTH domain